VVKGSDTTKIVVLALTMTNTSKPMVELVAHRNISWGDFSPKSPMLAAPLQSFPNVITTATAPRVVIPATPEVAGIGNQVAELKTTKQPNIAREASLATETSVVTDRDKPAADPPSLLWESPKNILRYQVNLNGTQFNILLGASMAETKGI